MSSGLVKRMVILFFYEVPPMQEGYILINFFLISQFVTGALSMGLNGYIVAIFAISSHFRKLEYYPLALNCLVDMFGAGIVAIVAEVGLLRYRAKNVVVSKNGP